MCISCFYIECKSGNQFKIFVQLLTDEKEYMTSKSISHCIIFRSGGEILFFYINSILTKLCH